MASSAGAWRQLDSRFRGDDQASLRSFMNDVGLFLPKLIGVVAMLIHRGHSDLIVHRRARLLVNLAESRHRVYL